MIIPVNLKEYIEALCYIKSDTYTQQEILSAINTAIENIEIFRVVNTLPTSNIKNNKVYLVPNNIGLDDENRYDVFVYSNGWEQIDNIGFNINDYLTIYEAEELLSHKSDIGHTHNTSEVQDTSAYNNIGSAKDATQKTINTNINTKIGNINTSINSKANSSDVYLKTETYTRTEITNKITEAVGSLELVEIVTTLPTSNIKNNKLYLVSNNTNANGNKYDIYLRVGNNWEQIDSLEFNIGDYATKDYVDTQLDGIVSGQSAELTSYAKITYVDNGLSGKADKTTATTSVDGLMSSSDKSKLDGISTGANKTTVDSALSSTSTNPVQNKVINGALNNKAGTSTATTTNNGLMSSTDKSKLDGIATGADKTTVDASLNTTSTNPVQNKAIQSALTNLQTSCNTNLSTHESKNASTTEYGHVKYDITPTKDSPYVLTSDAIFKALLEKSDTEHNHGNISNDGKIGVNPNRILITTNDGVITTTTFGTTNNTIAQGNHNHDINELQEKLKFTPSSDDWQQYSIGMDSSVDDAINALFYRIEGVYENGKLIL